MKNIVYILAHTLNCANPKMPSILKRIDYANINLQWCTDQGSSQQQNPVYCVDNGDKAERLCNQDMKLS